jgi:hypothetical protein
MATFSKIDGAEPSTVTFRLRTVTQDMGGQTQHQEIVTLGGTESSLAVAAVRDTTPASTEWALAVREVAHSTGPFAVSSIAGPVTVRSSAANALVSVYQSTAADLNVTVAGYVAPSTTVNVSSLGGAVIVRSSAANALVTAYQSSAADLNVTVAGYSTTVNVSSLGGAVSVLPNSSVATRWFPVQVSDGSTWVSDSTNRAIRVNVVAGSVAGDTSVTVNGNQSSNSSVYLPVRLTNGTAFLSPNADYLDASTASNIAGPTILFDNGSNVTMRAVSLTLGLPVNVVAGAAGGSTIVTVSTGSVRVHQSSAADLNVTVAGYSTTVNVSSLGGVVSVLPNSSVATRWFPVQISDGSTWVSDSTNRAIRVNVVAGAAGGSTEVTVRQSTIGDFKAAVYQSTAADLNVTVAGYSTTVNVSSLGGAVITRSSAANMLVTAYQSTAADLNVTVAGYVAPSTTIQVSSLGGAVITRSSAANMLVSVYQSTAADLNVTVAGYSTTVNVSSGVIRAQAYTSSGGGVEGSTGTPAAGVTGLHVRQVYPTMNSTTVVITSTHSTAIYSLISSVASLRHKVYAYFVGSTHTNPSTLIFCSSASASGFDHWHVNFGSGSSGITGANMAMAPPGFIFAGVSQNALNVKLEGGSSATSTVIARVSVAWFDEA